jgi:hypothetical protein
VGVQPQDGNELGTKIQTVTSTTEGGFIFRTVRGDRETYSIQRVDAEGRLIRISEYSTFRGVEIERMTFTQPPQAASISASTWILIVPLTASSAAGGAADERQL